MDEFTSDEMPSAFGESRDPVFASRPVSEERQLLAENRRLHEQLDRLTAVLDTLQRANEGAYRELAAATGGARFEPAQPFPPDPPRRLGQLPRPTSLRRFL